MFFQNHLQLGRALAAESRELNAHFLRRELFLLGNVLPDFLFYTYLRGYGKSRRWTGHSLPHSAPAIEKNLKKRLSVGLRSCHDAYRLGILIHYLSDSFTYPHTERFTGRRSEHTRYEHKLLKIFPRFLHLVKETPPAQSADFLAEARRAYLSLPPSPETDAEWIVRVCSAIFFAVGEV
ncbi:MAG: zinc dependent phospholipase C family protein [Clostridia bacterium]|nr:zinc dependent phospholipase C family protein [Clostridia bacterium]MBQ3639523.1 zinc dependent phospholipase C family protein [Clostridia bacterium]